MARLFLVRHGRPEAVWGGVGSDPGLSGEGRRQAEAAARALVDIGRFRIVTSPMKRCQETAAPYAAFIGAKPHVEPRVSEIRAPVDVEDRQAWLLARFPWRTSGASRAWQTLEPELHIWRDAMLNFVRGVREDAAVFTHFIAINVMTGAAMGSDDTIVCRPDHASITEIEVHNGTLRLVRMANEMSVDDVR